MSLVAAPKKIWTILDLLNWGTAYLTEKGFDESRLTIELLLTHVLHIQRIQLYTNFDRPLQESELAAFKDLLKLRLAHKPVQYILGTTEFMGLPFTVDSRVLIPRPETELLVEHTLQQLRKRFSENEKINIVDLGTGSGCIAISLCTMLTNAECIAIDCSDEALEVARHNATINTVETKIQFQKKNIFTLDSEVTYKPVECIISNPPYISAAEFEKVAPEVSQFEPPLALTDKKDGLSFYPALGRYATQYLKSGGILSVEHQYDQSEAVQNIFQANGLAVIEVVKDYDGNFRCVIAEKQ